MKNYLNFVILIMDTLLSMLIGWAINSAMMILSIPISVYDFHAGLFNLNYSDFCSTQINFEVS